jgi:hypothetical protein
MLQSNTAIAKNQIVRSIKLPSYTSADGIYKAARVSDEVGEIFSGFGYIKIL